MIGKRDEGAARAARRRGLTDPLVREVGYLELLQALERPGCAVCNAADRAARRYLDALLWEFVNDPGVRDRLRSSLGFCGAHTALAVEVAAEQAGGLGMAILYEDFLRHARVAAERAARLLAAAPSRRRREAALNGLRPDVGCPACEAAARAARNGARLLSLAGEESRLGRAARQEGRGVCIPHLALGLEEAGGPEEAERLMEVFRRGVDEVAGDLLEHIRKHDYRHADEPPGREADVWRRAPWWVVGRPGTASYGRPAP